MKYEINLFPGKKGWELSLLNMGERIIQGLTSTYSLLSFGVGLLCFTVLFFIAFPFFKVPPVHKTEIKNLKLMLQNYTQQRSDMFMQANILMELRGQGILWSDKLVAIGKGLPQGMWLSRISFEEEKKKTGQARLRTRKEEREIKKRFLIIEGSTYARERESPIKLVGRYIKRLNQDPNLKENFQDVELKAIKTAKEDRNILTFQLSAQFKELFSRKGDSLQKKVRDIILQQEKTGNAPMDNKRAL